MPVLSRGAPLEEDGFTLVEVMVASFVALVVLCMASMSTIALTRTSVGAIQRGSATGPALLAVQDVQQILSRAWTPNTTSDVTSDCAGGTDGQSFQSGNGPFVPLSGAPVSATDLMFCAVDEHDASTAHTYELHFTNCSGAGQCDLELDEEPAYGCTGTCSAQVAWSMDGVSDTGTPFSYFESTSWTTPVAPSHVTLDEVQAIDVTLAVTNAATGGSSATSVERLVLLPNTLPTGGS